jgi:hypothetical protein
MIGTKSIAMMLCLALGLATLPAPLDASERPAPQDYARREADSPGLEEFQGGFHGVVITIFALAVVGTCIGLLVWDCPGCRYHYYELPPAEGRRGGPPN